jgi:hypothetical protein
MPDTRTPQAQAGLPVQGQLGPQSKTLSQRPFKGHRNNLGEFQFYVHWGSGLEASLRTCDSCLQLSSGLHATAHLMERWPCIAPQGEASLHLVAPTKVPEKTNWNRWATLLPGPTIEVRASFFSLGMEFT